MKLQKTFDTEVSCIGQLTFGLRGFSREPDAYDHLVIGGKNVLKLYTINYEQDRISNTIDILGNKKGDLQGSRPRYTNKFSNITCLNTQYDTIACEVSTGTFSIFKISGNGKSALISKFSDHKRSINSLSFVNHNTAAKQYVPQQVISGSQDGTIKLWDLRSNSNGMKASLTISPNSHSDPVRSCEFSPHSDVRNKHTVLAVYDSGSLCKYDLRNANSNSYGQISNPERKWNFHSGPSLSLNIHPEKEVVITGGRDKRLCILNYSESSYNHSNKSSETIVNTYGPVSKVRWCDYSNVISKSEENNMIKIGDKMEDKMNAFDREEYYAAIISKNQSQRYDFACMYLNEDPTISVYNLGRKYIPKEVITTSSNKGFQGFLWALNNRNRRILWTINKSKNFTLYDLDSQQNDMHISKPINNLSSVCMSWDINMSSFCFVNQEKNDFESGMNEEPEPSSSESADYEMDLAMASNDSLTKHIEEQEEGIRKNSYNQTSEGYTQDNFKMFPNSIIIAPNTPTSTPSPQSTSYFSSMNIISPSEKFKSSGKMGTSGTRGTMSRNQNIGTANEADLNMHRYSSSRPALVRNLSQSTQESSASFVSGFHNTLNSTERVIKVKYCSPYVFPLSIPLPLNDEIIFAYLSENYILSIPDGFEILDVCMFNADISLCAKRFRESQVWKVIAESLLEEVDNKNENKCTDLELSHSLQQDNTTYLNAQNDATIENKSISSDIENVVGSYNSYSTHSTNYGGGSTQKDGDVLPKSPDRHLDRSASLNSSNASVGIPRSVSSSNLLDMIHQNNRYRISSMSPSMSRSGSDVFNKVRLPTNAEAPDNNESAIEDDPEVPVDLKKIVASVKDLQIANEGIKIIKPQEDRNSTLEYGTVSSLSPKDGYRIISSSLTPPKGRGFLRNSPNDVQNSPRRSSIIDRTRSSFRQGGDATYSNKDSVGGVGMMGQPSEDLDNENFMLMSNAGYGFNSNSLSSGASSQQAMSNLESLSYGSNWSSHRSMSNSVQYGSHSNKRAGFKHSTADSKNVNLSNKAPMYPILLTEEQGTRKSLNNISEDKEISTVLEPSKNFSVSKVSELTKGFSKKNEADTEQAISPSRYWETGRLLVDAIEYAAHDGNICLAATLVILFYYRIEKDPLMSSLTRSKCSDWISTYIDILRRHELFINVTNIINNIPKQLLVDIKSPGDHETKLRFSCNWCNKLLEHGNHEHGSTSSENRRNWFCESCKRMQLNCIYCEEPCQGLNVVVSLKCGHRGHFGCLKEWFVEGQNMDCPGGCNETII